MKDAPWRAAVAAGLAVALVLTVQAAAAPPRVAVGPGKRCNRPPPDRVSEGEGVALEGVFSALA